MIEHAKQWVRSNFFTKKELVDQGALDSRYFREAEVTSAIATHAALTATHGATGAIVGTTNTQTLTNKTLTAPALTDPVITGSLGAWSTLTLNTAGNWADYGGSYAGAAYRKFGDIVMVRGVVVRSSGADAVIGTLPTGYRPTAYILVTAIGDGSIAAINILTNGNIELSTGAASSYLTINSIFSVV